MIKNKPFFYTSSVISYYAQPQVFVLAKEYFHPIREVASCKIDLRVVEIINNAHLFAIHASCITEPPFMIYPNCVFLSFHQLLAFLKWLEPIRPNVELHGINFPTTFLESIIAESNNRMLKKSAQNILHIITI